MADTNKFDFIIIGAGIVGLSTAYKLSLQLPDCKIALIEKEDIEAKHQTGNNSGVIHSGLYYKPGSLKAQNCVNGYKQLIDFAKSHGIPYEICGKIVVAVDQKEEQQLDKLYITGQKNGLEGIKVLEKEEIKDYEPHVSGTKALHVPQTGIISYKDVSKKLRELLESRGATFHFNTKVNNIKRNSENIVETTNGTFKANMIINCGGLYSDKIARLTTKNNIKIIPFRGEYYKLSDQSKGLVRNLIYPVPNPNFPFLGVHFTRMIGGGIEAGPNAVLAFSREGYKKSDINLKELTESITWPGFIKVASKYWQVGLYEMYRSYSKKAFTKALQRLIPEIKEQDLVAGGSGVRAQACDRKGGLLDDFSIIESAGAINVCNAPSPAATSSLSIADTVSGIAIERYNSL